MMGSINKVMVLFTLMQWQMFIVSLVLTKEGNTMHIGVNRNIQDGISSFIATAVREAERFIPKEYVSGPEIPSGVTKRLKRLFGIIDLEEPSTPSPTTTTDQRLGRIIDSQALVKAEIITQEPQIDKTTEPVIYTGEELTTEGPLAERSSNGGNIQTSETLSLSSQKISSWNDTHVVTNWTSHSTLRSETSQNEKLINILESINRNNGSARIRSTSKTPGNPEVISKQVHIQTDTMKNESTRVTEQAQQSGTNQNPLTNTDYRRYLGQLPPGTTASWFDFVYLPWITGSRYIVPGAESPSLYQQPQQSSYTGPKPPATDQLSPFSRALLTQYLYERLLDSEIFP